MNFIDLLDEDFNRICRICGSPNLFYKGKISNGIATGRQYKCFSCNTVHDVLPDYEGW